MILSLMGLYILGAFFVPIIPKKLLKTPKQPQISHTIGKEKGENDMPVWGISDRSEKLNGGYAFPIESFTEGTSKIQKSPEQYGKLALDIRELVSVNPAESIDAIIRPSYNKKKNKEDNEMSLVGLWLKPEETKVVAFADSKSTKIVDGKEACDESRTPVQKIFAGENQLMVAWGQNSFSVGNNEFVTLERIIEDSKGVDQSWLWGQIRGLLKEGNSKASTSFLYVTKNYPVISYVSINAEKVVNEHYFETQGKPFFLGGDGFYVDLILKDPELSKKSTKEFKEKLEEMVRFRDTFSNYNPVGGPIQMVEWDWGLRKGVLWEPLF